MVKGVSRRVVVVRPEEGASFEQAIFIVKDGSGQDVMREACAVAERYLRQSGTITRRWHRRFTLGQMFLSACAGAGAVGLIWLCTLSLM